MNAHTRKARGVLRGRRADSRRLHWLEVHMRTCPRGTQCVALTLVRLAMIGHRHRPGRVMW